MLKFYLTTQESYIIFQALQKILNSNNIDIATDASIKSLDNANVMMGELKSKMNNI